MIMTFLLLCLHTSRIELLRSSRALLHYSKSIFSLKILASSMIIYSAVIIIWFLTILDLPQTLCSSHQGLPHSLSSPWPETLAQPRMGAHIFQEWSSTPGCFPAVSPWRSQPPACQTLFIDSQKRQWTTAGSASPWALWTTKMTMFSRWNDSIEIQSVIKKTIYWKIQEYLIMWYLTNKCFFVSLQFSSCYCTSAFAVKFAFPIAQTLSDKIRTAVGTEPHQKTIALYFN